MSIMPKLGYLVLGVERESSFPLRDLSQLLRDSDIWARPWSINRILTDRDASITNCHRFSSLKQHPFISQGSVDQKSGLAWLGSLLIYLRRCQLKQALSWRLRRSSFRLLVGSTFWHPQVFAGQGCLLLLEATCIPFHVAPSISRPSRSCCISLIPQISDFPLWLPFCLLLPPAWESSLL